MRGPDIQQDSLFSTVIPEERVPKDHPLRPIRQMVNEALAKLDQEFNELYADCGKPSIPPEKLLRAQLLMAFYTIRSERQLMEQIDYKLLFRWFVGFSMDDEVWDHSTFSKNRDRLLEGEVAHRFFDEVLAQARKAGVLSKEHFSVDGTLIEVLASHKSYRPKDEDGPPGGCGRNPSVDFRGEKRSRDTHESKTDPDALLFKKSKGAASRLSYMGHVLMENRNGLVVKATVSQATGTAEREAAVGLVDALGGGVVSRWARTKTTIPRASWKTCVKCGSRRTWPRMTPTVRRLLTNVPPGTRVTGSARTNASVSRNALAG